MHYNSAIVQFPLVRECAGATLRTPADVYEVCKDLQDYAQEHFQVLSLNTKNRLLNRHLVSVGLCDASLVHPREVFRQVILESASCVILTHNHPSGDATPSAEDLRITRQLIEAGRIIDIKVMDHVIIGRPAAHRDAWLSLRESGLCQF
jgi:DNA repair protein RadC